ncbi:hypothetical protein [Methanococcus maripaludis]|uniref:Uncharacterized protein n=1 Tax=Methanococcus maripaludis TaxID=39152 RepID=A0A7J9PTE6_METMI|nr:hypothetical protein [Methanococcus maripaludis]MBA2868851.1 hypothetical protein [Methanococcus maripaludis]
MDTYSYWKYGLLNLQVEVNPKGRLVNPEGLREVLDELKTIVEENESKIFMG